MASSERTGAETQESRVEVREIAIPGTHAAFTDFLVSRVGAGSGLKTLDIGAGQGALSKRLHGAGFEVSACELHPEGFLFPPVECRKADLREGLPYDDGTFDAAVAVEVLEHLVYPDRLFSECGRVLKAGGLLAMSTPNILSLKSRLRFLASGFFYSFKPLDAADDSGLQHVSSLTVDQYAYLAKINGFEIADLAVDKYQTGSILLLWLWPLMFLLSKLQQVDFRAHGRLKLLLGRKLFILFRKLDERKA